MAEEPLLKNVTAAASASTSGRGADINNAVSAASASTSGRGAGVNNGGSAASAVPAVCIPTYR